eukprot:TRINITY_DN14750_c0_g1_i1.p1 TRINITY_DN14750_c0_g1~~TRINITY_DN14750_c0_g1_i1.p1  ORF type:complete len:622 (-),score=199.29 TRINITY_DN14750_c0_g1_i1:130-1995(-)
MSKHFRDVTKDALMGMINEVDPESGWKVLIVDHNTLRVLTSALQMHDLMDHGVALVELIDTPRESQTKRDALYFLSPEKKSVELLSEDFQKGFMPKYKAVHLYFTQHADEDLLTDLATKHVFNHIESLKELDLDFTVIDRQCFSLPTTDGQTETTTVDEGDITCIHSFYSPNSADLELKQAALATKLATVCATLGEFPLVRYGTSHGIAKEFAQEVQQALDDLCTNNPGFPPKGRNRDRGTLLILDRTVDLMSPLLHEFTYEAMGRDVLCDFIHGQQYIHKEEGSTEGKVMLLNQNDPIWEEVRFKHLATVTDWLKNELEDFTGKNKKALKVMNSGGSNKVKDVRDAVKGLPEYQETSNKFSLHFDIASKCFAEFGERKLEEVASLEQNMATGETPAGKLVDSKDLQKALLNLLPNLSNYEDKVRLIMLFVITQKGIKPSDRRALVDAAELEDDEIKAISNLTHLNVNITGDKQPQAKKKKKVKKDKNIDNMVDLSRYETKMKSIFESLVAGSLDQTEFPYLKAAPPQAATPAKPRARKSLKSKGLKKGGKKGAVPGWAKKPEESPDYQGGRLIVFVIGGVTPSEVRSAEEVMKETSHEIVLGSTSMLHPRLFVEDVQNLA